MWNPLMNFRIPQPPHRRRRAATNYFDLPAISYRRI
jgi:hypothetical protein